MFQRFSQKKQKLQHDKRQGDCIDRGGFGKLSIFFLFVLVLALFFAPPLWLALSLTGASIFFLLQGFVVGGENTRYCFIKLKILGIAAAILGVLIVCAVMKAD